MSRRTYTQNAFETQLQSAITAGSTSIALQTVVGLQEPGYLVIDPDSPTKREFIRFNQITGSNLENLTRGLEGSAAGAQSHDVGTPVRTMSTKQELDDLYADIEDLEAADAAHVADPDPHPTYLTQSEGDNRYVELAGDTMTGPLQLPGDPTLGLQAATKQYVDTEIGAIPVPGFAQVEQSDFTQYGTFFDQNFHQIHSGLAVPAAGKWLVEYSGTININNTDVTKVLLTFQLRRTGDSADRDLGYYEGGSGAGAIAIPVSFSDVVTIPAATSIEVWVQRNVNQGSQVYNTALLKATRLD